MVTDFSDNEVLFGLIKVLIFSDIKQICHHIFLLWVKKNPTTGRKLPVAFPGSGLT